MLKQFIQVFTPPVFSDDEDKTRKARYTQRIVLGVLAALIAYQIFARVVQHYSRFGLVDWLLIGMATACISGLARLRQGHVRSTSIMIIIIIWIAANGISAISLGVKDASFVVNLLIVLMAGLLLNLQAAFIFTVLSIISGIALAYAESTGWITVLPFVATDFVANLVFVFILNLILIRLLVGGLEDALRKSRLSVEELGSANAILNFTQGELQSRSTELVVVNKQLEIRSEKLHGIAEVARITTAIRSFDQLLPAITNAISEQLGYYHVGLFLLDVEKQYAILRATNTAHGLRMLNRGYRVAVGSISPIGYIAQTGQPRVTRMNEDATFLHNVDFPETKSQVVLPLGAGDNIIGVLDIQSQEANAFNEDDLATLSIMADQVTIAIQNALLYEQAQTALREADIASRQTVSQAWNEYEKTIQTRGYRYDGIKSEPLKDAKLSKRDSDILLIPVQLRDQTIGCLKLNSSDPTREWTEDELIMMRAIADRVALALESARLLDEAEKRARRESFLSDVTARLGTSFQLDSILRDTVEELGQTLKNSTVTFQLVNPSTPPSPEPRKSNGSSADGNKVE